MITGGDPFGFSLLLLPILFIINLSLISAILTFYKKHIFRKSLLIFNVIGLLFGIFHISISGSVDSETIEPKIIEEKMDTMVFDCYNGSQLEMNICSQREYHYYDSILQAKYNMLLSLLDSNLAITANYPEKFEYEETMVLKNSIINSQKAWISFRNSNAEVQGVKFEGGTMETMIRNNQMTTDTKDRIKWVRALNNEY
jgi:uncharacterized protein YecT (DUF1311 family)